MDKKTLVTNLQLLQGLRVGGEPSRAWTAATRKELINHAVADVRAVRPRVLAFRDAFSLLFSGAALRSSLRPAGVFAMSIVLAFGGWGASVSASYASVPGDALYGIKRATERAQLALTTDPLEHARLQVDFVGRRVDEITRIAASTGAARRGNLVAAVQNLRTQVTGVEDDIDTLRKRAPSTAVSVASLVDQRAGQYHAALRDTDTSDSAATESALKEAKDIVVDASVKAITVIIEGNANGAGNLTDNQLASKVGERISAVANRISDIEDSVIGGLLPSVMESASQARTALGEAATLVEEQDLSGALVKVIEGKALLNAAENIAIATSEAAEFASATGTLQIAPTGGLITTGMSTSSYPKSVSSTPVTSSDTSP